MVYSTRRFVVCLSMCHFVLVFYCSFSIAITSLGEERANLSAFRTFVRFVLVWICRFLLPLGVWEGLRFVIVPLPGLFAYLFFLLYARKKYNILFLGRATLAENGFWCNFQETYFCRLPFICLRGSETKSNYYCGFSNHLIVSP